MSATGITESELDARIDEKFRLAEGSDSPVTAPAPFSIDNPDTWGLRRLADRYGRAVWAAAIVVVLVIFACADRAVEWVARAGV